MPPLFFQQSRGPENRKIDAFRSATGENHLARLALQNGCGAISRIIQQSPRPSPHLMDAGGISECLPKEWQHGVSNGWIERRGRVVIEIDGPVHMTDNPEVTPEALANRSSDHGSAVFEYPRSSQKPRMSRSRNVISRINFAPFHA